MVRPARGAGPREQVLDGGLRYRRSSSGVLLTPERRALAPAVDLAGRRRRRAWSSCPTSIWNVRHGWPFFELMRNIRASGRDVVLSPVEYVLRQVLNMNPATLPDLARRSRAGSCCLGARAALFRPLGWAFLVTLATFVVTKGKDYYLAPAFATLFAAGAVGDRGLHGAGRQTLAAAAGPRRAAGPLPAAPADGAADPARRAADRLPGAARPGAARHARRLTRARRCRTTSPGSSAGTRWWRPSRRLPRDAAGGAGAGRDHRQQLRRVRRRRPARPEVRPAAPGARHAPELLALGTGRRQARTC